MTFLTPLGGLVALAALPPLAAWALGPRPTAAVRLSLGLDPPRRAAAALHPLSLAGALAVLGAGAAQPALTHRSHLHERAGVEAVFVVDVSRSMAASATAGSPTRLDRAVAAAARLRAAIPDVPAGVATLTDRVLPNLLPVADAPGFDAVVQRAVAIESPPPAERAARATSYAALGELASGNYFSPRTTGRLVVLLTDGESDPVDPGELAGQLSPARGYRFVAVRFWRQGESVYDGDGRREAAYRPDPLGRVVLAGLAGALGGHAFDERHVAAAAAYLRRLASGHPVTTARGVTLARRPLAPYLAALALVLLALCLLPSRPLARTVESAFR